MITAATDFYSELTARNTGFISPRAQGRVREATVLVAGCGSTGGAAVEPLARVGVQRFILADNGDYELNNLNRQQAGTADIGRNKAVVNAERVRSINPHARVDVRADGIAPETVDDLVGRADVVVDGVDVTEMAGMAAKFALHESAARLRVPVISGYDMAGLQFVRCYDYREAMAPLAGAVDRRRIERSTTWELLARLIPKRAVPVEMIRSLRGASADPDFHVSQLVYTSMLFGAITTRMTVELLAGVPVRRSVRIDVHRAVRRPLANLRLSVTKPVELIRTLRSL